MFKRQIFHKIINRLQEDRGFIQILAGPRQIGKTTLAYQLIQEIGYPVIYASADDLGLTDSFWIQQQWDRALLKIKNESPEKGVLLILDEVQKISQWPETVKKLWDENTASHVPLKIMLIGSSALLVNEGLSESLTGRFEVIPISHWSFQECRDAFGWTAEQYIYFGGYPGSALLVNDQERWSRYIRDSLIETSISKDILQSTRINKPALLKRVFELGCIYSGQILSYQKMLGQLHEAGNASTLSHYLDLLSSAGLVTGLQKFSYGRVRQKSSSPKLQVINTALMSAQNMLPYQTVRADGKIWGRVVESAIGAHLVNSTLGSHIEVFYWREGNAAVDFILRKGNEIIALEVKTGLKKTTLPGVVAFHKKFGSRRSLLIGAQGIPVEEFLLTLPETLF